MDIKIFNGKKIKIRGLSKKDLKITKKFQDFINSLVKEDVQILINKEFSFEREKKWLGKNIENVKNHKAVFLVAENNGIIIGTASIDLDIWRKNHIGDFAISIRKNYRGIGVGSYLIEEIIKLAKKELKPRFIKLSVFSTNKPAMRLYKKYGFKEIAKIPKQIKYKGKLIDEIIMMK